MKWLEHLWPLKIKNYLILKQSSNICGIPRNSVLFERSIWYSTSYRVVLTFGVIYVLYMSLSVWMYCVSRGPWQPTGVTRSLELSDMAAENWTLGPLVKQQTLLTTEPSLQSHVACIFLKFFCSFAPRETTYKLQISNCSNFILFILS